jgi:DNA-cytosine methyltransferase
LNKIKSGINVLSLFDGMSCGQIALNRSGFKINNYYAAEIDKYAITVAKSNYPNTQHLGSVTDYLSWDIDWSSIDLLIGGSPCQGFSYSGKRLAFDDPRSQLFFFYVDILNHIRDYNPNIKFLLENVRMEQRHVNVINDFLDTTPVLINSSLVSAQIRNRLYWTNWEFNIPEDKEIYWPDVMLHNAEGCMYYSEKAFNWIFKSEKRAKRYFEYSPETYVKMQMLEASHHKGYSNQRCFGIKDTAGTRYIHPIECERLQNVPDNYTNYVSRTQRYKMLGNGWTVDIICAIMNGLKNDPVLGEKK